MESPAGELRSTSVVVLTLDTSEVYIVVSLSSRTDTQVIYIDPTTGSLRHDRKLGYDVFNSQDEALNYITDGSKLICKSTTYAKAIVGYAVLGSFSLLLVATKLTASIPNLPGGGYVYTISESQWIKIILQNPQPQGKGEVKNIQELTELEIDGTHFFCETRDITRPFPSRISIQSPDDEFVWNGWFSIPFRRIGLEQHCVILLQGFAEYRSFGCLGQQEGFVALIARRSKLHPGTRYLARGLNSCYSTGNEVECEQLVWVPKRDGQSVPFNTYIWRRGTIPIWWGAELKMTAAEAVIYVSNRDPYKGSALYYQRLSKRYDTRNMGVVGSDQKKSALVPIVCVNLLKSGEGKSESILVQHFAESLNHIQSIEKLPSTRVHLINYDWHTSNRLKGEQQTIEGLWYLLKAPTISIDISEGDYLPSRQHMGDFQGELVYNDDLVGVFCLRVHQNGVIRYNCADSLDRTNAASYFGSLQVFTEQCRRLGISLDSDMASVCQSPNNDTGSTAPLLPGWEKQSDAVTGKSYYTDHNTGTTTWNHPCPDKPWKRFDMTFEEFKRSTILSPVCQLADLFLIAGDIHATLYTGSKAMHSHVLNIFSEEAGKSKQFSVAQNVKISLQRRYNNAVVDSYRHKQLEMFLGLRLFKHLPSASIQPLHVFSRRSGCLLKPVAGIEPSPDDGDSLLSFKRKNIIWVCPQAADIMQLFVYLGEPCHVCQLLLTISHGSDDSTYPSTVDVRTGRDLDVLKLVVEGASIPRCANGTNMVIPIPGPVSDEDMAVTGTGHAQKTNLPFLYDFEEPEGELDFLTRVVVLTFYPAVSTNAPVTLGEVEILGISLPWRDIFAYEGPSIRLWEQVNNISSPSEINNNLFAVSLTNDVSPPEKSDTSTSAQVDLLSGEDIISGSVSQPVTNDSQRASLQDKISIERGAQHYISCFKMLTASHVDNRLGFVEAMKLEIERLRLDLSAAARNRALLSIGVDPATINPNMLLDESYVGSICRAANSLAVLGQASLEDQTSGVIGLGPIDDNIDIDFWNINKIGEGCCADSCQVHAVTSTLSSSSESMFLCSACHRKVCRVCCAGKGAILLQSSSRELPNLTGGSSYNESSSNSSLITDLVICKLCCQDSVLDALSLDHIRVLISQRRSTHAQTAAYEALGQVAGKGYYISEKKESSDKYGAVKVFQQLLNEEESLAEFPHGSFLHSIESAPGSAPPLSLLAPLDIGLRQSYWKAPPSTSSVEFIVILGSLSDVSGVVLLVSQCGYSMSDSPTVQIWASNKIHKEERSCLGKWDVRSLITSSPELCGSEKTDKEVQTPRHIKFRFQNPVRCRMIWIKLCLQKVCSNSVDFEKDCNLISLDETSLSDHSRRATIGGTLETEPCLHAKRILVVGCPVKIDIVPSTPQSSDQSSAIKSWLEKAPALNRYKIPVESEKLIENDLVLEQYIYPASPVLAGFRLDGFSAIKPRLTHSPCSDVNTWIVLEDRFISPPLLYIQVSALLGSEEMVVVAEYQIPEVKAWTPMYFDFPQRIMSRRMCFRLVGDVASFADDPAEQDDSEPGGRPLATGLSLLNRIKLYYYAHPSELGRWASLSGI